jgi:hypothetical protein
MPVAAYTRSLLDNMTMYDSLIQELGTIGINEIMTLSDSYSVYVKTVVAKTRSLSDSMVLSDSLAQMATIRQIYTRLIRETMRLSDSWSSHVSSWLRAYHKELYDTLTLTDALDAALTLDPDGFRNFIEGMTLKDTVTVARGYQVLLKETMRMSED